MYVSNIDTDFFENISYLFRENTKVKVFISELSEDFDFNKNTAVKISRLNSKRKTDIYYANTNFFISVFSSKRNTALDIKEKIIDKYSNYTGILETTDVVKANIKDETNDYNDAYKVYIESVEIRFFYKLNKK